MNLIKRLHDMSHWLVFLSKKSLLIYSVFSLIEYFFILLDIYRIRQSQLGLFIWKKFIYQAKYAVRSEALINLPNF